MHKQVLDLVIKQCRENASSDCPDRKNLTMPMLEDAVAELSQRVDSLERDLFKEVGKSESWEGRATNLAAAVGHFVGVDVGEHSSANCPIQNALSALRNMSC